jgi:hypothetical protein
VYLKLIEKYDLEKVINALECFIIDFSHSISPFAIDLFRYLSNIFIKMFNKDLELSEKEDSWSEM